MYTPIYEYIDIVHNYKSNNKNNNVNTKMLEKNNIIVKKYINIYSLKKKKKPQ